MSQPPQSTPAKSRRHKPPAPAPAALQPKLQSAAIASLWLLLLALAIWHGIIALQSTAVIHWRRLDELAPWLALAVLQLAGEQGILARTLQARRLAALFSILLMVGALLTALGIAWDPSVAAAPAIAFTADIVMCCCALALASREYRAVSRALRPTTSPAVQRGITILQIWRFAAAQWALLMAATTIYLAVTLRTDDRIGREDIRRLLFLLPAGVLLNAMMAAGIGWWGDILHATATRAQPRVRAWLAAFVAVNMAGLLLVLRPQWLGIPGALAGIFAVIMYLIGFPALAWRSLGGKAVLAAWLLVLIALAASLLERILLLNGSPALFFYGAAWRHLWLSGALVTWLLGYGILALEHVAAPESAPALRRPALIATLLGLGGALITAGTLLSSAIAAAVIGVAAESVGLLIAGAVLLRFTRSHRLS
jgi:hypothetical protein